MENNVNCDICGNEQDSKHFGNRNICTTCADILEDVMSEFFVKTIHHNKPRTDRNFIKHLRSTTHYISKYSKIREESKTHINDIGDRVSTELKKDKDLDSVQRYFEYMKNTIDWLEKHPEFYSYYFKDYFVCNNCNESIFEKYSKEEIGDWLIISCSSCNNIIKKYFSPKKV